MPLDFSGLASSRPPTPPSLNPGAIIGAGRRRGGFDQGLRALQYAQQRQAARRRRAREEASVRQPGELMDEFRLQQDQLMVREKVTPASLILPPGWTSDQTRMVLRKNFPSLIKMNEDGTQDASALENTVSYLFKPQELSYVNNAAFDDWLTGHLEKGRTDSAGASWDPEAGINPFIRSLPQNGVPTSRAIAQKQMSEAVLDRLDNMKKFFAPMVSATRQYGPDNERMGLMGLNQGAPQSSAGGPAIARPGASSLSPDVSPLDMIVGDVPENAQPHFSYPMTRDLLKKHGVENLFSKNTLSALSAMGVDSDGGMFVDMYPTAREDGSMRSVIDVSYRSRDGQPMKAPRGYEGVAAEIETAAVHNPNLLYELLGQGAELGAASRESARRMGETVAERFGLPAVRFDEESPYSGASEATRSLIEAMKEDARVQVEAKRQATPPPDPIRDSLQPGAPMPGVLPPPDSMKPASMQPGMQRIEPKPEPPSSRLERFRRKVRGGG